MINKKAIAGQVVIMLFAVIVIIFIILLGISSTQTINQSVKSVNTFSFKNTLLAILEDMSYLEVKEITISLDDVSEACFINDSISSVTGYKEEMINLYFDKENEKNLLLFQGGILVDAISLGKNLTLEDELERNPDYLCFANIMGNMYFKVKNYNTYYVIKKE